MNAVAYLTQPASNRVIFSHSSCFLLVRASFDFPTACGFIKCNTVEDVSDQQSVLVDVSFYTPPGGLETGLM